jgi:hypothetical protein
MKRVRLTTVTVQQQKVLNIPTVCVWVCVWVCVCILASVIWHATRMRRILLSSVACLALPYFSTLSHKTNIREAGGIIEHDKPISHLYQFCKPAQQIWILSAVFESNLVNSPFRASKDNLDQRISNIHGRLSQINNNSLAVYGSYVNYAEQSVQPVLYVLGT